MSDKFITVNDIFDFYFGVQKHEVSRLELHQNAFGSRTRPKPAGGPHDTPIPVIGCGGGQHFLIVLQ